MKPVKPSRISNLERSVVVRGAALILPALLSILALGGVTARPMIDISDARSALERSEERSARYRTEAALHERYRSEGTLDRSNELIAAARSRVPESCSSVVAHGVVRLASAKLGIELSQLQVALDRDLGLPELDLPIVAREVALSGRARSAQIVALLDELSALGFPNCVFEATLRRSEASDPSFEFHIDLGLLHFTQARRAVAESEPAQEQP